MPRLHLTPGKDPVPIVQEAGWASGPVWIGAEHLAPTGIRSPDRPACRQSLYRLSYPAHWQLCSQLKNPDCSMYVIYQILSLHTLTQICGVQQHSYSVKIFVTVKECKLLISCTVSKVPHDIKMKQEVITVLNVAHQFH